MKKPLASSLDYLLCLPKRDPRHEAKKSPNNHKVRGSVKLFVFAISITRFIDNLTNSHPKQCLRESASK